MTTIETRILTYDEVMTLLEALIQFPTPESDDLFAAVLAQYRSYRALRTENRPYRTAVSGGTLAGLAG